MLSKKIKFYLNANDAEAMDKVPIKFLEKSTVLAYILTKIINLLLKLSECKIAKLQALLKQG